MDIFTYSALLLMYYVSRSIDTLLHIGILINIPTLISMSPLLTYHLFRLLSGCFPRDRVDESPEDLIASHDVTDGSSWIGMVAGSREVR